MEFVEFLVEAKKNTYAKEEEGRETILENGCREEFYGEEKKYSTKERRFTN
ncbi:MAG: hypothetical protein J7L45_02750 [Candidatus Aenigmarchaeota archaeon]|nr:hypothetical protein [Candidatus Aenigmarchaeota archaeon]